jgi:hypothetical protein
LEVLLIGPRDTDFKVCDGEEPFPVLVHGLEQVSGGPCLFTHLPVQVLSEVLTALLQVKQGFEEARDYLKALSVNDLEFTRHHLLLEPDIVPGEEYLAKL